MHIGATPKNGPKSKNHVFCKISQLWTITAAKPVTQWPNAWYSCLSTCRETTTKRTYPLEVRCGLQNEPKSRNFVRKIEKIFFSHIISESSKTYRKPLLKYFWIFFWKKYSSGTYKNFEKMGKIIFCLIQPNRLKRMVNRVFVVENTKKQQKSGPCDRSNSTISAPLWLQEGVSLTTLAVL